MARTSNYAGEAIPDYERLITSNIHEDGGHWIFTGRAPIGEVRLVVAQTLDDELPDVKLFCVCGTERCVRPSHLDWTP